MHRKLSYSQRQQIEQLLGKGQSQWAIARAIGVHRSTVNREICRNSQEGIYRAFDAHAMGTARKVMAGKLTAIKIRLLKKTGIKNPHSIRVTRWLWRIDKGYIPSQRESYPRDRSDRLHYSHYFKTDLRTEEQHPHSPRSLSYWSWKRYYEQNYRMRDHRIEGLNRRPRTAGDWRNYRYQKRQGIFAQVLGRGWQINQNAMGRLRYERRLQLRQMEVYKKLIEENEKAHRLRQKKKHTPPPAPPTWFIFIPLRAESRSMGFLCPLPRPDS